MGQLSKGTTFSSGQSVDHNDLNNLVDNATLGTSESTGAIGGQTEETSVASDDFLLMQDVSGTDILRKATVANIIAASGITQSADNTAVGSSALASISSGTGNVAVGKQALTAQNTGANSTAVGHQAAYAQTGAANDNVTLGYQAGYSNGNGDDNVLIGSLAAQSCAGPDKCVAVGKSAMENADSQVSQNVAVGHEALKAVQYTTGSEGGYNTAIGAGALLNSTTAAGVTAVGADALKSQTTPDYNTAVGYSAGATNSTATDCTYVGALSGYTNATGDDNTFIGDQAGYYVTGAQNTAIGSAANLTSGSAAYTNSTALGYNAQTAASNEAVIGDANLTVIRPGSDNSCNLGSASKRYAVVYAGTGSINTSDRDAKEYIEDTDLGLEFIKRLLPRKFKFKDVEEKTEKVTLPDGTEEDRVVQPAITHSRTHYGLIAQEVKEALGDVDFAGYVDTSVNAGGEGLGLRYDQFISILIKAVQELSAEVEALKSGN